jgi:uncharacterized repeat protein (TIGR01451 family)
MQSSGASAYSVARVVICLRSLAPRLIRSTAFGTHFVGVVFLWGICAAWFFFASDALAASSSSSARLWNRVTPAAGVPIRSATSFRAFAISSTGTPMVDIYQINNDGTSTKLDTIVSTTTGAYGAGTYTTHNMAAIYWQFTIPPTASAGPPPVSVTFINDNPAVALSGLYYNALPQTPFAPTDRSLLLNLDLRKGPPVGWSNNGTGAFDATNGYMPGTGSTNGIANTSVPGFSNATQMPTGTVAVRFQRVGVATDNHLGALFWDSTGNTLNAATQNRQLFVMRSNSGNWVIGATILAANIPLLQVALQTNSMSAADHFNWQTMNSHYVPGYQDPTFADLVITWYQNQYYIFFDGHLVSAGSLGDIPTYQMMENICIGNYNGSGLPSGAPFGAYYIQQVQVSSRFLGPVLAGPTIGLLGDSFIQGYTVRANPSATGAGGNLQVSDVDAVQNALGMYNGLAALGLQPGQTAAFHQLQALMFENYGFFPPIYNAGQSGHGYSHINLPIDDAYIAALNQAAPAVIVAQGSINDVSPFKPSDGNLLADTESIMNRLVVGGGSRIAASPNPALEKIVYLEMLSSQGVPSGGAYPEPAYGIESQNLISITRTGMSNFVLPNSTRFSYVTSREWWDRAPDYAHYLYGTNPDNPYNLVGGRDYQNGHPDPSGSSVIAAHLYTPVADAIMNTVGADLSLEGTGKENAAGLASYSLTVSNAGPLVSTGATVTATLPSGTTFVAGSSSSGCTRSGQTVSCTVGTIAAAKSYALNLTLQVSLSTPTSITFSLAGSVYNPNSNNTLVVAVSPPPGSGGKDGPLPLWALGALGAGLIGIASRKLKHAR